jgi:hypothetical protein
MDVLTPNDGLLAGNSSQATRGLTPNAVAPARTNLPVDHTTFDNQGLRVDGSTSSLPAIECTVPNASSLGGNQTEDGSAVTREQVSPMPGVSLADPFLALSADIVDDLEETRIANENRLRQLTRTAVDADGEERGFGLTLDHPDVRNLQQMVEALAALEHQAVLQLQRRMRKHPLGPWVKAQKGVGEKQAARLLASIGDPYWHVLADRPRTVSQLWAYCGLHVLPVSQPDRDTHLSFAGGAKQGSDSNQIGLDPHTSTVGVAARRAKGQKSNWSAQAKMRAFLISESMLKAGNREVYDRRKAATEGRLHAAVCVRCGPKGKPAQPGSEWSLAHRHADALRVQAKELLKLMWREAKRLHDEEGSS